MKLRIVSDLHIDHSNDLSQVKAGDEDVVVCAGDVCNDAVAGLGWLRSRFPDKRIVFVPGNHEYYGSSRFAPDAPRESMAEVEYNMLQVGKNDGIDVLINNSVEINGIKFLGATLWSNFGLYGSGTVLRSMEQSEKWINDFRYIQVSPNRTLSANYVVTRLWSPAWNFLRKELSKDAIVVTHFSACKKSVAPQFEGDIVTPYFVNDHGELISRAKLWIHGHCHTAFDYEYDGSRVICNPSGYAREKSRFNPNLIVEV